MLNDTSGISLFNQLKAVKTFGKEKLPVDGWLQDRCHQNGRKRDSEQADHRPIIVSPDGKYLFSDSAGGGDPDVYWVDAAVIEELKPDESQRRRKSHEANP